MVATGPKPKAVLTPIPVSVPAGGSPPLPLIPLLHPVRELLPALAPTPGLPAVWSGVAGIKPELAARLIAATTLPNRKPILSNLDYVKAQLAGGQWEVNGDTIKFDDRGENTDGRHRLTACVETGRELETFVVVGLPTDTRLTNDTGRSKRMGDFLGMTGHDNGPDLAAAAKLVFLWECGQLTKGQNTARREGLTPAEQERLVARHRGLPASVTASLALYRKFRLIPRSAWSFFHYAFGRVDPVARNRWCALACGDEPATNDSGPGLLRARLTNASIRKSIPVSRDELIAIGIKSWRLFCHNKTQSRLYWTNSAERAESFPAVDPTSDVDTAEITGAPQ